jgi:hypothetical protein
MLAPLSMSSPGYRVAPLALVLAIVALTLALTEGWFSGSDTSSLARAFVASQILSLNSEMDHDPAGCGRT